VTSDNDISALGTQVDTFVKCSPSAMNWSTRRWRIIEEIIRHDPDIICLQEVDHFKVLSRALGSIGYRGR
jgi:mRNA deadenylase 3'-5' endonuclease subunit Ccr4